VRLQSLIWSVFGISSSAALLFAQTPSQAANANSQTAAVSANTTTSIVSPDDPVITLNGFCPGIAQQTEDCKTIITRAQFEKLTEALEPGMSLTLSLKVANNYARIMKMAVEAEKRGLDKTPAFAEEMRYARMQLLSQDLTRALQEEANNVTASDIEDYYKKSKSSFEQATLARIFIPHTGRTISTDSKNEPGSTPATGANSRASLRADTDAAAMAKLSNQLRARVARGEDPDQLQFEAYAAAGIPGTAPNTKMEKVRRASLPPAHEMVMDLMPGETSEVISDPEGAHFIYKMISKETLPLEAVSTEIRDQISSQRYKDSLKKFQNDTIFSDAYFAGPEQHAIDPRHHRVTKKADASASENKN
jgi:hypothetical protein